MFLIVEKMENDFNHVVLGPMPWRQTFFKNCLRDDLDIIFEVPASNPTNECIIVNENVKIMPVVDLGVQGEFNPKIQFPQGPYYNFYETHSEMYYVPEYQNIDLVKGNLKNIIAAKRYEYESQGKSMTLQGQEIYVYTARGVRDMYLQAYQMGKTNINWKFGNVFLTVTNAELGQIVLAVTTHVQDTFDWEADKIVEIDSATTVQELDAIELTASAWEPIL